MALRPAGSTQQARAVVPAAAARVEEAETEEASTPLGLRLGASGGARWTTAASAAAEERAVSLLARMNAVALRRMFEGP